MFLCVVLCCVCVGVVSFVFGLFLARLSFVRMWLLMLLLCALRALCCDCVCFVVLC